MLSFCREFISDRRQRVVIDGATIERIPIVSGVPHCSVLGPLLLIRFTREMFELVENRPAQITPHYWQLFVSLQTDQLLLPPGTEPWRSFWSGAITCA